MKAKQSPNDFRDKSRTSRVEKKKGNWHKMFDDISEFIKANNDQLLLNPSNPTSWT